tara:strand:- start:502 stop:1350 length:849 start_codon:yes stop_codon:yes gene_type:complete
MNEFIILTPMFNDWESLKKLIKEIDKNIASIKGSFKIIVINDCSTKKKIKITKLKKIKNIYVINLKKNLGSQRSISVGLKYLARQKTKSIITIMDSDGEDDPTKIKKLINLANKNQKHIITANRLKRNESYFLKFLNYIRLFLTLLITGKYINFGNFTSFHSSNLRNLLSNSSSWLAHSGAVLKNCAKIKPFYVKKKRRYFGDSKVGFIFLIKHSINIILIFKKEIFVRLLIIYLLSIILTTNIFFPSFILCSILILLFLVYNKTNNDFSRGISMISSIEKY